MRGPLHCLCKETLVLVIKLCRASPRVPAPSAPEEASYLEMGRRGFGRSSGQYTPYTLIQTLFKIAHIDVFPSGGNNTQSDFVLPHFRKSISQPAPKAMSTIDLRQTSRSSLGFNILKVIRPPLPQTGHIVPLTSQTMFRTRHEGI